MPYLKPNFTPLPSTLKKMDNDLKEPSTKPTGGFWTTMFVVDSRTGQPEFSKILAFISIIMLLVYQGYALFVQNAAFEPVGFSKAIAWLFGGLATHLGVSEFFRQRFDKLNGIRRDGQGGVVPCDVPPMMCPNPPDQPEAPDDNTPPQAS